MDHLGFKTEEIHNNKGKIIVGGHHNAVTRSARMLAVSAVRKVTISINRSGHQRGDKDAPVFSGADRNFKIVFVSRCGRVAVVYISEEETNHDPLGLIPDGEYAWGGINFGIVAAKAAISI